jgi:hypothetical protein
MGTTFVKSKKMVQCNNITGAELASWRINTNMCSSRHQIEGNHEFEH